MTTDTFSAIRDAFAQGADEITIRVSRYAADLKTPEAFQCLIKFQNRTLAWKVGIRADPVLSLEAALSEMAPAGPDETDVFG